MCAGAILASRIDRVVFGAWDPKAGAAGSLRDVLRDARMPHPTEVIGGVLAQEAAMQLRSFFLGRRGADAAGVGLGDRVGGQLGGVQGGAGGLEEGGRLVGVGLEGRERLFGVDARDARQLLA